MKLNLTYSEFIALHDMFSVISNKYEAGNFWDKLLHVHSTNIFLKLYKMAIHKKSKYTVKLTEEQAIAFFLLTSAIDMPASSFLGNLVNKINNLIHQKITV